jgi:hypothetical protein
MLKSFASRRFRVLCVLTGHLLVPLWLIALLGTAGNQDASTWFVLLFASAVYVIYIALAGSWSWFGIYMQRALPVVLVVGAFITRPRFLVVTDSAVAAEIRVVTLLAGLYFAVVALLAVVGRFSRRASLDLTFPLKEGTFIVVQGGSTRAVNRNAWRRREKYAVEIARLGKFGMRADGIYPAAPQKYATFGAAVLSPCEGVVAGVVEDLADNVPGERDRSNPRGNHVVIDSAGASVTLGHLMKQSVTVNPGQRVRVGQVVGRVGNSGDASEPVLRVQAEKDGRSVPLRFNGRFLVRNDSVEA